MTDRSIAIVGPTASGKTRLSIALAKVLDGEVISMDSRQVYRGMDIGTAKATPAERAEVPHHGLDIVDPGERYTAARFARDARGWIAGIRERGRLPILAGGTGFYLRALLEPVFEEPPMEMGRRRALRRWMADREVETLVRWVRVLDPERAETAERGGRNRLGRTLEVALLTGRPLSWWHRNAPPAGEPLQPAIVRLDLPREILHDRINRRAEAMVRGGLVDEVARLLRSGVSTDAQAMTGTGYRESAAVLRGELSIEEAIDQIQRSTRRYARRQETWFRHQLPPDAFGLDATLPIAEQVRVVRRFCERIGIGERG